MKKVSPNIRKRFKEDTNIELNKQDTYVSMKFKLCKHIYSNMSIQEIKNEISWINLKTIDNKKIISYVKNIIDVIIATISSIITVGITCYTASATLFEKNNKNTNDIISLINDMLNKTTDSLIIFMIVVVSILILSHFSDWMKESRLDSIKRYKKFKLECLNKVLNVKLEELNNPKQKTDYNHKHFKVKVSSIK